MPVDGSLVSMELPAGYTSSDKQFDMSQFTEQDFIESLRIWAEYLSDGKFPEAIGTENAMKQVPLLVEKLQQSKLSQEEGTQLGMTFGRGFVFFQQLDLGRVDWHYAGGGVKLGDAEKLVFWYQPKDSENYRVIYGDLSVEDVAPENLPE